MLIAIIRPFRALRPPKELAEKVATLPYDVMNAAEAREMAVGNPADAGKIMPPKSTWFEPKLRSGLFVHLLS